MDSYKIDLLTSRDDRDSVVNPGAVGDLKP